MTEKENDHKEDRKTHQSLWSLAQTLEPLTKKLLGKKGFVEVDILTGWEKIIGSELAEYTTPQKITFPRDSHNNGTLYLSVTSGAFALEIQHREKYILNKINSYFGYNAVSTIRIIQSQVQNSLKTGKQLPSPSSKSQNLSEEDKKHIENLTETIDNPKLKAIISKLGKDIYNLKNEKKES